MHVDHQKPLLTALTPGIFSRIFSKKGVSPGWDWL